MKRTTHALFVAIAASALLASGASASVQIGTTGDGPISEDASICRIPAGRTFSSCTIVQYIAGLADAPGGLAAPAGGVLTSWSMTIGTAGIAKEIVTPRLLTFSTDGGTGTYVGKSTGTPRAIPNGGGDVTFPDRIPVSPGDRLAFDIALHDGNVGDGPYMIGPSIGTAVVLGSNEAVPDGQSFFFGVVAITNRKFIANAKIEPDVDGDGYGDETQDGCVQRADVHTACPPPTITNLKFTKSQKITFNSDIAAVAAGFVTKKSNGQLAGKKRLSPAKTTYKTIKNFTAPVVPGANTINYKKIVGAKGVSSGSYRVKLVFTSAQNTVTTSTLSFTIKKPKKKH
jgi:hypothetical protein